MKKIFGIRKKISPVEKVYRASKEEISGKCFQLKNISDAESLVRLNSFDVRVENDERINMHFYFRPDGFFDISNIKEVRKYVDLYDILSYCMHISTIIQKVKRQEF